MRDDRREPRPRHSAQSAEIPSGSQAPFIRLIRVISKPEKSATRAPDPRPARTRAAILAAIERLGAQGQELSVSGVVVEAGLSRSSFYSQFKDLGDVAVQLIQELYERPEAADLDPDGKDSPPDSILTATGILLREFEHRRPLYAAVLGTSAAVSAQWAVCDIMAKGALRSIGGLVPEHIEPEFAARHIASGYLANMVEWLNAADPVPVEEFEGQLRAMLPEWVAAAQR